MEGVHLQIQNMQMVQSQTLMCPYITQDNPISSETEKVKCTQCKKVYYLWLCSFGIFKFDFMLGCLGGCWDVVQTIASKIKLKPYNNTNCTVLTALPFTPIPLDLCPYSFLFKIPRVPSILNSFFKTTFVRF